MIYFSPESDPEEGPASKPPKENDQKPDKPEIEDKNQSTETVSNKKPKKRNRNRKKDGQKSAAENKPKAPTNSLAQPGPVGQKKKTFDLSKHRKAEKRSKIKELNKKDASHISENRLRALGINPKKYQNKLMYGSKDQA